MAAVSVVQYNTETNIEQSEFEPNHSDSFVVQDDQQDPPKNESSPIGCKNDARKTGNDDETTEEVNTTVVNIENVEETITTAPKQSKGFYKRFLRAWRRKMPLKETADSTASNKSNTIHSDNGKKQILPEIEEDDGQTEAEVDKMGEENSRVEGEDKAKERLSDIKQSENCNEEHTTEMEGTSTPTKHHNSMESNLPEEKGNDKKMKNGNKKKEKAAAKGKEVAKKAKPSKEKLAKQESLPAAERRVQRKPRRALSLGSAEGRKRPIKKQQARQEGSSEALNNSNSSEELSQPAAKWKGNWLSLRLAKLRQKNKNQSANNDQTASTTVEEKHSSEAEKMLNGDTTTEEMKREVEIEEPSMVSCTTTPDTIFEPRGELPAPLSSHHDNDATASSEINGALSVKACDDATDVASTLDNDNSGAETHDIQGQATSNNN